MALDEAAILRGCRLLERLEGPCFETVRGLARPRRYRRGTMIFREGEECPGLFVVGSGLVRVFKIGATGKEHVLHFVAPGLTFAEVAAIGGFACPAHAEALEDTDCVLLPAGALRRALERDHALCLGLMQSMAFWVRRLVGLMEDIALRDAAGRLARYLLEVAGGVPGEIRLPGAKKHLASHLNLTGETLSRTLRRLDDAGLIRTSSAGRVVIRDLAGLEDAAAGLFPRY
jgi:CRP/FNR family transcriptional regulator